VFVYRSLGGSTAEINDDDPFYGEAEEDNGPIAKPSVVLAGLQSLRGICNGQRAQSGLPTASSAGKMVGKEMFLPAKALGTCYGKENAPPTGPRIPDSENGPSTKIQVGPIWLSSL
jgi:hypothetical protein